MTTHAQALAWAGACRCTCDIPGPINGRFFTPGRRSRKWGLSEARQHLKQVETLIGSLQNIKGRISGGQIQPQDETAQAVKYLAAAVEQILNELEAEALIKDAQR